MWDPLLLENFGCSDNFFLYNYVFPHIYRSNISHITENFVKIFWYILHCLRNPIFQNSWVYLYQNIGERGRIKKNKIQFFFRKAKPQELLFCLFLMFGPENWMNTVNFGYEQFDVYGLEKAL